MEKISQSRAIAKCQPELSGEAVEESRDPRTLGSEEEWETRSGVRTEGEVGNSKAGGRQSG